MSDLIMGEPDEDPTRFIYLVRHGETAANEENLMRGWDDPELNEDGVKDAKELAKAFEYVDIQNVFCSTLKRAVATMQTIVTGKPIIKLTDNLKTIDVGAWAGQPVEKVEPPLSRLQKQWETNPDKSCPHGESWTEFQGRQLKAWRDILRANGPGILVVSHLRCSVWAMGYALTGCKPLAGADLELLNRVTQETARITTFSYSKVEGLKILAVNAQTVDHA